MRNLIALMLALAALSLSASAVPAKTYESETIKKTFTLERTAEGRLVAVSNVWGAVKVTGHSGDKVEMTAIKTIEAGSVKGYERALDEVVLDISEEDGYLELYVDGPFRGDGRGERGRVRWRDRDYRVYYEFELKVPKDARLEVSCVNDGEIEIRGVSGDYEVLHVNDDIEMKDIEGSGEVYTVNGDVTLDFKRNPAGDCRFGSLNGEVRMHFQPGLSADFRLKTFNGDFFTDFDLDHVPSIEFAEVEVDGGKIYRAGSTTVVRAGKGGPAIELDGFNGDMYILEAR
jgi:DUF4097 and DUF4098 domain-containing protein YvlB